MASSDADVVGRVRREVAEVLRRHRALNARRPIVVAVSGGADSLCLLDALVAVVPRPTQRLFVGHVDHQLRPGSAEDGQYVRHIAEGYGVPGAVATVDVPSLSSSERLGPESAARIARYRELRTMAQSLDTDLAVTGHTEDDQAETVMMHVLRGSGLHGLAGIPEAQRLYAWSFGVGVCGRAADLQIVRPLLNVSRADTTRYCEARGIHWLTDETNADPSYTRNRVRGHLLPVLRTYNPAINRALARMARAARDEDTWLASQVAARWRRIARVVDDGAGVDLAAWRRQPVPIQRRLIRAIVDPDNVWELGFDAVERALAVGAEGGPPRAELGHGITVERRADTLVFVAPARIKDD